jgi:hypothetical protein
MGNQARYGTFILLAQTGTLLVTVVVVVFVVVTLGAAQAGCPSERVEAKVTMVSKKGKAEFF